MARLPKQPDRIAAHLAATCGAVRRIAFIDAPTVEAWLDAVSIAACPFAPAETAIAAILTPPSDAATQADVRAIACASPADERQAASLRAEAGLALVRECSSDAASLAQRAGAIAIARSDRVSDDQMTRQWSTLGADAPRGDWLRALAAAGPTPAQIVLAIELRGWPEPWRVTDAQRTSVTELALTAAVAYESRFAAPTRRRHALLERLSASQRALLPLLLTGLSEREIARRVGRSAHTIHGHARAICLAWGVASRLELRDTWQGVPPPDVTQIV